MMSDIDMISRLHKKLVKFKEFFSGEIFTDKATRILYATDASMYEILPLAVAYPKTNKDLQNLVLFCKTNNTSLIPRTAGTSLGGQCVGEGIVVDCSRYLTEIIEINADEKWVRVQPGVVRDELNLALTPYNLHFGPNTSTSNRAMIGGMVGNNSSGSYSIKYGSTRDNLISVKGYLSNGDEAEFGALTTNDFRLKTHGTKLENAIYRQISFELSHPLTQDEIMKEFPKKSIHRRNTGYAVDILLDTEPFHRSYEPFNFAKLLCGSEGTLMLMSEIKLQLVDKPTDKNALICAHFDSLEKSLQAAVEAMKLQPNQCELMDKLILDCTKDNIIQNKNRFFIQGDPQAILMIEVEEKENSSLENQIEAMETLLRSKNLTYASSVLYGEEMKKALQLRAAGLGVLQNLKGDDRALEFVEDTAVDIEDLPNYIAEFDAMIKSYGTTSVFYAHAGAGELHTRPRVNLKTDDGRKMFRNIATASAHLIKKYNGSLSGEHGDGIVRSEFIPIAVGVRNYELFRRIKQAWDSDHIFNPGKIVDATPMDQNLREDKGHSNMALKSMMSFAKEGDVTKAAEKCSGSGDCRKTEVIGGTMCPSFQATRNEKDSTRARANILRNFLTGSDPIETFRSEEIYDILKLCLSCKACISECPSSVDMAALKSEFLYQYHQNKPHSRLEKNLVQFTKMSAVVSKIAPISNFFQNAPVIGSAVKRFLGIDTRRSLPNYSNTNFESWYQKNKSKLKSFDQKIYLYVDEFTNYLDADIAIQFVNLLQKLEIGVTVLPFIDSSRSLISKGFLEEAKRNINLLVSEIAYCSLDQIPIVGIEPSAILGFRDDYHRLIHSENQQILEKISAKTMIAEEYLADIFRKNPELIRKFTTESKTINYHGHCHQKSLSSSSVAIDVLNFPKNFVASEIKSGCCGMAGSFGYEHYEVSMKVGELVLFPAIRKANKETITAASGTSCRHQIKDGMKVKALHPIEILYKALQ
jgi:FAD/FMN-containing dehydrogenase/Fe-S oxidoreductase